MILGMMRLIAVLLAAAYGAGLHAGGAEEFFEKEVRPLLAAKCAECHGEKAQSADVDFRKPETVIGKAVIAGDESSPLIRAVRYESRIKMPPTSRLAEEEIAVLIAWVRMGAPWPGSDVPAPAPITEEEAVSSDHWSFQPVADPPPPDVRGQSWVRNDVDRFILAKLEAAGLQPAPEASQAVLLRRAKFDLLGLPPTIEEIDRFRRDTAPGAFARLVDRLLASPHYGERWGRRWLDAARYADSMGVDEDKTYDHAWRYRDYVIDAFNRDLPYDRFVREQIAGDLLPAEKPGEINARGIIATGFLALGPKALAQRDPVQKKYDVVDEQIDTTSKAFLGLTIACARCHDHKFDPISTKDYYALAGIFAGAKSYGDWRQDDSRGYTALLVEWEVYNAYRQSAARAEQWKRLQEMAEEAAVARYLLNGPSRRFADYMLAAGAGAARSGLDAQTAAWFEKYLQPRPIPRPHLTTWRDAPAAQKAAVAAAWRKELRKTIGERAAAADAWLEEAMAAVREGEEAPEVPELPTSLLYEDMTAKGAPYAIDAKDEAAKFGADDRARLAALAKRVEESEAAVRLPEPPLADCVAEGEAVNQRVFVRGDHKNPGEPVSRRFPLALAGAEQDPIESGSGRLELARWLGSKANPLSARVMVNRIWNGHFGEGIVRTPNNFGLMGERPTHPELLDWLASRFVANGWSVKRMHRLIMTSAAYRMSSGVSEQAWEKDPDNKLLSRFKRRRLSFEEMRDSYLAAAGMLDPTIGGKTASGPWRLEYFDDHRLDPDASSRRSIYLPLRRGKLPTLLALFDFGDAARESRGKRSVTNTAPQALYAMNSGFTHRAAGGMARRLLQRSSDRLKAAYELLYSRPPNEWERGRAQGFLETFAARQTSSDRPQEAAWTSLCKMLLASNEFHYVD